MAEGSSEGWSNGQSLFEEDHVIRCLDAKVLASGVLLLSSFVDW